MFDVLVSLLSFVLVVAIIITCHEFGHFACARFFGVEVDTFSIGFGSEVWGWTDGKNTRWRISALPLGGYVKFRDDEDALSEASPSMVPGKTGVSPFSARVCWSRLCVALAGPFANFLLSSSIWSGIFFFAGVATFKPTVGSVVFGSPAWHAGLRKGDKILNVDGVPTEGVSQAGRLISSHRCDQIVSLEVERGNGGVAVVDVAPDGEGRIGVVLLPPSNPEEVVFKRQGLGMALYLGVRETYKSAADALCALGSMVMDKRAMGSIGGPIQIAELSGRAARNGLTALFHVVAALSVSVGLINLLPIPVLDGGRVAVCLLEAILGRYLSGRLASLLNTAGALVLFLLFTLAMWNDLAHLSFVRG